MANALFVDALKGYEYYLSERGKINLDQINEYLLHNGRNPIAHRTYMHYQKLLRSGFRNYIPINKFDVFESIGKIQIAADRRRYHREAIQQNAELSIDGQKWVNIEITDRSIVGFGILTLKKYPTRTGIAGWIRLSGYHNIPVVIVWRKHEEGRTRLGVRAMEFIAKFRIKSEELKKLRPSKLLTVKREAEDALEWDNFYGILTKIDELIRSAADLIYSLEELYDIEVHLRQSSLKSIKFGSPGETIIKIDFGIADILRLVLEKVQYWGLQKRKLRAEVEENELNNEAIALANQNAKIELLRNVINLDKEMQDEQLTRTIVDGLKEISPDIFGAKLKGKTSFTEESPELAILTERVIPAALDLAVGDDSDYIASIGDE